MSKVVGLDGNKKGVNDIEVNDAETVETKKEVVLVGFDRIAKDMRVKVEKLARKKGISSFNIMGIPTREGVPKYSGGMVGNPEVLVEGLYSMAKQRPEIKALLEITVNALKETELLQVISIAKLHEAGKISAKLFNTLDANDIMDLKKLTEYTYGEVLKFKNIGDKSGKDLIRLLEERGMEFKNFKKTPKKPN